MSYDKNKDSMVSFILSTILKDELEEICVHLDKTQSQVLRESVSSYIRFVKEQYIESYSG
jgi:predicted DNA-binding protein